MNASGELVNHMVIRVDRARKRDLLTHLVHTGQLEQALVFVRTKHGANKLALQLERDGIRATAIHGNKTQRQRVRALADFNATTGKGVLVSVNSALDSLTPTEMQGEVLGATAKKVYDRAQHS